MISHTHSIPSLDHQARQFLSCLASSSSQEELLQEMASIIEKYACAEGGDIWFKEKEHALLCASTTFPEYINRAMLGKGLGVISLALERAQTIVIPDNLCKHAQFATYPGADESRFESGILVPFLDKEHPIGVVFLRYTAPKHPTPEELKNIEQVVQLGAQTWKAFHNAYKAGSRTAAHLGALNEVAKIIASSPYVEEILQLLVNITAQQFNYKVCSLRLLDSHKELLVLRATYSPVKAYQQKRAIQLGESIAGRAIRENKPVIVKDVQNDEEYIGHDLAVEIGLRSMICVPLTIQNRVVGVLSCYTDEIRDFHPDEIRALETLAKQAAISIEHAKLQVRSTLMQEMHHRVKNNLQQVVSLLRLQLRSCAYTSAEEAINDTLSRILAIAAVHDLLSRDDLDHVSIKTITESLIQMLQHSMVPPSKKLSFFVKGHDVYLNMNQATQIALILNELIQNSIEHGFRDLDSGEIRVTIEEHQGDVILRVSENGSPLPPNFTVTQHGQLGLQIVDSLSRSMGGSFKIESKFGWTIAEVRFHRSTSE